MTMENTILDLGVNHEGQGRSAPKANQLSGRPYATFTSHLKLIQTKILQKSGFCHPHGLAQFLHVP
jgi:hypothetical protein